nr:MAG TPA: hypothetical protein [Caudoviricetes sp.]
MKLRSLTNYKILRNKNTKRSKSLKGYKGEG